MIRAAVRSPLLAASALLAAAPAAAQGGGYPLPAVVDALRGACSDRATVERAAAGGALAGWTRAADPAKTPVGPVVALGLDAVRGTNVQATRPAVFARTVAGRPLHIVVSGVTTGGTRVIGCRLYDTGATARVTAAAAQRVVGRAPARSVDRPELQRLSWEPGLAAGQDSFEIYFVPPDSPVVEMVKLGGLALKVDWVDAGGATKRER